MWRSVCERFAEPSSALPGPGNGVEKESAPQSEEQRAGLMSAYAPQLHALAAMGVRTENTPRLLSLLEEHAGDIMLVIQELFE